MKRREWCGGGVPALFRPYHGAMESVLGKGRQVRLPGGGVIHKSYPPYINIIRRSHPE